jgi:cyclohexa-1,5-dienecarbonyl-CoA hydratase
MSVLLERHERWACLTIERPPLNILDRATIEALDHELASLEGGLAGLESEEAPQLLLVRGGGDRAFSAGVAVEDHVGDRIAPTLRAFHRVIVRLRRLPSITLAVVQGHCLGGGMELALACDLVLATSPSTFGQPEIQLGCYPPVAAALYPALIGRGRTLELLLTGRTLGCREAEALGLVTWRVETGELESRVDEIREQLLSKSAAVTQLTKRAVDGRPAKAFEAALAEAERIYLEELTRTEDMNEGLAAFLEKRAPTWKHR